MDKYIGRLLDNRYEILEVIGTGGMAVVYKARCHRLNRLVAIKILKNDYLEDEDFRRRFHAESQAVAMLSHPNIVSVYDVSTSISLEADYIVMELIEGITLKQYMQTKGYLNWKETLHFGIQIAKALEHAHSRGIVHRDIKPHNVMVLKNGSVKVTDFGIARMMSKGNTLTKEALGSVHYISPEQAKGGRVDSRSDLYSLGVVMYEMMSGRPPYDGDSPVAVAIQHINGGAPMPSTLNPNIPGGLEQIIMKAMSLEPGDRYSSASQMLLDMDEFRRDPTMLFDYNTPPLDVVTQLPKMPPVPQEPVNPPPRTTADRVASRLDSQKRTTGRTGNARPADSGRRPPQSGSNGARSADAQRKAKQAEEARRKREQEEQTRNRVTIITIIICALVALGAIAVFLVLILGGGSEDVQMVTVPKLVGDMYDDVQAENPDLKIKLLEEAYDENAPAGTILEQDPAPGTQVEPGRIVFVTVSLGPEPKAGTMGDLVNYTESTAISYLDRLEMGLKITIEQEYSDDVEEGKVIRTEPAAETALTEGQEILLVISLGKEIKTGKMPNVVDVSEELARRTLDNQDLELVIEVEKIFDNNIEEGNVIRTIPERGEDLKTGMTVTLYISKGPELVKMPNVVGMDVDEAKSVLEYAGFINAPVIVEIYSEETEGNVLSQSVKKNEEVEITTKITLEVSKGPEPTTAPPEVTKDVTIALRGVAAEAECTVVVIRDGVTVFSQTVPAGTTTITIPGQTGNGSVLYNVIVNDSESWEEWVEFNP